MIPGMSDGGVSVIRAISAPSIGERTAREPPEISAALKPAPLRMSWMVIGLPRCPSSENGAERRSRTSLRAQFPPLGKSDIACMFAATLRVRVALRGRGVYIHVIARGQA